MLFEILGTLECLATEVTLMWLEWDVDTDVRSNVISLDGGGAAVAPLTGQVQVVGALATNVTLTNVILRIMLVRLREMTKTTADGVTAPQVKDHTTTQSVHRSGSTYVELLSRREPFAATLPLADKLVARRIRHRSGRCRRLLGSTLRLLLWCGRSSDSGLGSGLFSAHG